METQKRPFVFTCTGMSLDGKISNSKKECSAISSDDNREMLYDSRVDVDAIMIGGNTLKLDDPGLTLKSLKRQKERSRLGKSQEPVKVCVISNANNLKISGDFFDKGTGEKIIFTTNKTSKNKIDEIKKKAKVFVSNGKKINLKKALETLYKLGIEKLLVEGGGEIIFSLLKENLIDEINLKIGDLILGGRNAVTMCEGEGFDALNAKKVKFVSIYKENKHLILKAKIIK
jgi:2,5-diamino-6-(ribosylamino)-4(3H)-pyrimidinone 5'-phosphate reductase